MNRKSNTVQAFWVGMGSLSSMGLSLISAMILSRYFDKAEYGTYKQILYIYSTLLVIFSAGLPRVFAYFLPRYSLEEGKSIVWKISKILFFSGLAFSFFLFLFSDLISIALNNSELAYGLKVFSPVPMLLLPTLGIEGIFATYKKTIYIAIYNTLSRLLMLVFIVFPVVVFDKSYIYAIYGWLVASFLTLIIAYFFKGIPFKGVNSQETQLRLRTVFNYSLPLVLASLWGVAIKAADQFYISRYFGAKVFAEFSNGFIELPLVSMVTASTSIVLMPLFSKAFHENNGVENLLITWRSALNKSALVIYPLVVFFIAFSSNIMILLYSEIYENSATYFKINMALNFFNIVIFAPLFFSMGKTKLYANVHLILAFFIWIMGYIMIVSFNTPIAIAISSTSIHIVKILVFMYLGSKMLRVSFFDLFPVKRLGIILLHSLIIIIIIHFLNSALSLSDSIFVNLSLSFTIYIILILLTGPLFKLDYLLVIRPIINKIINK